jgi:very-short-patch-repair endonuclease/predicted transcriptional regulator of viral defense system
MPSSPDHRLDELAAAQHGTFTLDDARISGLTHAQIDARVATRWSPLYEGVFRIRGAPSTWRGELLAATFAAGDGAAISHRSAAALYKLPGADTELIELTCLRWKRTVQPRFVVHESRRLDARDVQSLDGIPVTTPERTLLDLASIFPRANYLEFIVQAARRRRLITFESTKETFDRHARRGLKGVAALREVLDRWDPGSRPTESEMETVLLLTLRRSGLPEPTVQYEILDSAGRFVARADAAYPEARVAIEYDSKQEHSDEFQIARDARRRNAMQAAGYLVLSVRLRDLQCGGNELCDQIRSIMRRTAEPA